MRSIRRITTLILLCIFPLITTSAGFPEGLSADGARLVWVDFWASWCAPCRRSFPWMNAMQEKYAADGFAVIAVNVDKDGQLAEEFLNEIPAKFTVHYDPAGRIAEAFDVQAMPSSFLLDADGNIIASHFGFRLADTDQYEAGIREALASGSAH